MKLVLKFFLLFVVLTNTALATESSPDQKKPRVSIITSIYKGDEFMEGFLADITRSTIFNECELILINANSPGNEEPIIKPYLEKYPNISYERLEKDPGVYGVWNIGIKKARADFITNANIDDRRNPQGLETHAKALEEDDSIDLAYSDYLITKQPNETYEKNSSRLYCHNEDFSVDIMYRCLPGPQPMWRKSIHDRCGYFSEQFATSGDHDMWNRAVITGSKFKSIPGFSGLYYENPRGLSTKADSKKQEEDQFVAGAYFYLWRGLANTPPKLLIKIATRSNPDEFFNTLNNYYIYNSGWAAYQFLITLDENDATMNNPKTIEKLRAYPNLDFYFGKWESPVAVQNRDIDKYPNFDILLLAKDNMITITHGYEKIIANRMTQTFPDYDGVLNIKGALASQDVTMPVIGKKYYERFEYVYHPEYQTSSYEDELMAVSKILQKNKNLDEIFVVTSSPSHPKIINPQDQETFNQRRESTFHLNPEVLKESSPKLWSILICTSNENQEHLQTLVNKLIRQSNENNLNDQLEVILCKDFPEKTVASKRNDLIAQSHGEYISFIEDKDDIHDQYIKLIAEKLVSNPDCVSLTATLSVKGENPIKTIRSAGYQKEFEKDGILYGPPNHQNPIKRAIAVQFEILEPSKGEPEWSQQIVQSGLLKKEAVIEEPYYFY